MIINLGLPQYVKGEKLKATSHYDIDILHRDVVEIADICEEGVTINDYPYIIPYTDIEKYFRPLEGGYTCGSN